MYKTLCSSLFWEIPHHLIVNVYYMPPPNKKNKIRYKLFAGNISILPIFPSSELMVFVSQKIQYLHLVQIFWNKLIVLFYLSVHTDVSISCLFLCTYTSKYMHNIFLLFLLPQPVDLKSISQPFSVSSTVHMLNKMD